MRNYVNEEEIGRDSSSDSAGSRDTEKKAKNKNRSNSNEDEDEDLLEVVEKIGNDYHRQSMISLEEQIETSKLVLQLVTDSRFNMTQINGQRKLGGPPPGWKGPPPGPGCEVFVGKIPRTLYEHEIYPIFRRMGEVYEIRLMMDFSGTNRGYCFVMFGKPEFAQRAIKELDNYEIRPGRKIGVVASINNCRLYVGQLPPDISSETVIKKIYDITDDVGHVAVYRNASGQARYALISYKTHRGAAMARRRLVPDRASLFNGAEVSIDWAHPGMYPSNVVEECGTADDHGNVEMTRVIVGNENKRYQTRRRARDEFLDHSIRAYICDNQMTTQRNKQTVSQQRIDCLSEIDWNINSASGGGKVIINPEIFDDKLSLINHADESDDIFFNSYHQLNLNSDTKSHGQGRSSKNFKDRCKSSNGTEITEKSLNLGKEFVYSSSDLNNLGSCSSESSASSSQSTSRDTGDNISKEFSDLGIVTTSLNIFGQSKYGSDFLKLDKNAENSVNEGENYLEKSGERKVLKNDGDWFNLFDSYNFSRDNNREEDNKENFSNDSKNIFCNLETSDSRSATNFFANIVGSSKSAGTKETQNSRQNRNKKNPTKEVKSTDAFSKAISAPQPKKISRSSAISFEPLNGKNGKLFKLMPKFAPFEVSQSKSLNLQLTRQNELFREWQSTVNSSNISRTGNYETTRSLCPQNRQGIDSLLLNNNNQKKKLATENIYQSSKVTPPCNSRNNFHKTTGNHFSGSLNFNSNQAKKAWLSAQLGLNDCVNGNGGSHGIASSFSTSNSMHNSFVYPQASQIPGNRSAPIFIPHNRSIVTNIYPEQNFHNFTQTTRCQLPPVNYQNHKLSTLKIPPKGGRPILSRSQSGIYNDD